MARLPRYFVEGQPQHVIQRGNNRSPIFASDNDYEFFLACLREAANSHGCSVHAYVLMTNHIHLLATPATASSLPKVLQSVGRRYVQHFNHAYRRTGTLWEGRYRATVIDSERYLLTCMRYIELNPVRAGMIADPGDYRWSSYAANALGHAPGWLVSHPLYERLGSGPSERCAAYRDLFRIHLSTGEAEAIREATNKAWGLGNDGFRGEIEALAGRRAGPKPRGRPRLRRAEK